MRAYSIFDDFPPEAAALLEAAGVSVTLASPGTPRPSGPELRELLRAYDAVFISTAQIVDAETLRGVEGKRIVATVSSGVDHIQIPAPARGRILVANAPTAGADAVAEHVFALFFALLKRLTAARTAAVSGQTKASLRRRPGELRDRRLGVMGAGPTAAAALRLGAAFGMRLSCWTPHPALHRELETLGVRFVPLDRLLSDSELLSLQLPRKDETRGFLSAERIEAVRRDAAFVSVSRPELMDLGALFRKARAFPEFSLGLDLDAEAVRGLWTAETDNVIVTPHIAGSTPQARSRMFLEAARGVAELAKGWG